MSGRRVAAERRRASLVPGAARRSVWLRLAGLGVAGLLALHAATVPAQPGAADGTAGADPSADAVPVVLVHLRGLIGPRDLPRLRAAFAGARADAHPSGALLLLDSEGGDGLAAMEIGRMARAARAHVFVTGRCASACTLILAGGVVRAAPAGSVGIHRGRIERSAGAPSSAPSADDETRRQLLATAEALMKEYLEEMGVPRLYRAMQAVPSNLSRWPDAAELDALGLTGIDARWRDSELPALAAHYGIDAQTFAACAARVPETCAAHSEPAAEFIRCYRGVLRGSESAGTGRMP